MTVESINNALIDQFSDLWHLKAQQITARFKPYVQIRKMTGDTFAYDGLGTVELQETNTRMQKIEFTDIEHTRRKISRREFYAALPIALKDVEAMLLDPESPYIGELVKAFERQFDRIISEAAFADVYTGRDFDTTVTFAEDGGLTVDATGGLTYAKLLEIGQNFINNDVGLDQNEKIVFAISGKEHTKLMTETQLTSGDYSRQYVVDKGQIQQAVGMDIIKFAANAQKPVLGTASSERSCIAMSSRAICVGVSRTMKIDVEKRSDYLNTDQVIISGVMGAVRTEGALIQKVQTVE